MLNKVRSTIRFFGFLFNLVRQTLVKGPYPLDDFLKFGAIIGGRQLIIAPATLWVWPKIAGQSLGDHHLWATGPPTYIKNV